MISKRAVLQDNHHSRNVLNNNKTFELTGFTNNNYWIIPHKAEKFENTVQIGKTNALQTKHMKHS